MHPPDEGKQKTDIHASMWANLGKDKGNVILLIFLYLLQGISLGLAATIPVFLQNYHGDYNAQAVFGLAYWPTSISLVWAPIVDGLYSSTFGKRKSWIIPVQCLLGIMYLILSSHIHSLLSNGSVLILTVSFIFIGVLTATQDIATVGWGLTMLKKEKAALVPSCNTIGTNAGFIISNGLLLALESADFCNKYLRNEPKDSGVLTIEGFLFFWGLIILFSTTYILFVASEKEDATNEKRESIFKSYHTLWRILKLPAVKQTCFIILTSQITFAASEHVAMFKLRDAGLSNDIYVMLQVAITPIHIIVPLIIGKYTSGPRPLQLFLKTFVFRLAISLMKSSLVWITPMLCNSSSCTWSYTVVVFTVEALHQVTWTVLFNTFMTFIAKVIDPAVGGTSMTLFTTVYYLSVVLPKSPALYLVAILDDWTSNTIVNGYFMEVVICSLLGILWLVCFSRRISDLEAKGKHIWTVK